MSTVNKKHEIFISEYVRTGNQTEAYKKAYPKASQQSARVKSYTLLQNVTVRHRIKLLVDQINAKAQAKAVEELKNKIVTQVLDSTAKRAILKGIAEGKHELFKTFIGKNGAVVRIKVSPDHTDVMKAIDLDNKMAGHYAPDKVEIDHDADLKTKSDEELLEMIKKNSEILRNEPGSV